MRIQGHGVLISGGASGMGAQTARHLAALGAKVAILDQNIEAATILAKELDALAILCDVTNESSVLAALVLAKKTYGPLRACINCAGIIQGKRIVGKEQPYPLAEFKNTIEVNLIGTFNVMRLVAASMAVNEPLADSDSQERGIIINTASIAAFEGQIGQAAYSASKGGIVALTLPAARELAQFNIRVMTIAPGLMSTPMLQGLPEERQQSLANQVTFPKRLGQPQEYAKLVAHIIENEYLNAEVIRLDGGIRMQDK